MSTERCVVRLGGPLPRFATRVTRKRFRTAKEFALQRDDTMAVPASARRVESTCNVLEAKNVEEILEVALRNADVVAGKNRNGCIESMDFFNAGTRSAQIDLVLVGAVGKPAGARDGIHHG